MSHSSSKFTGCLLARKEYNIAKVFFAFVAYTPQKIKLLLLKLHERFVKALLKLETKKVVLMLRKATTYIIHYVTDLLFTERAALGYTD